MDQTNEQVEIPPKAETAEPVELPRKSIAATLGICAAGWIVPGLSHVLIGRWIRGLIFLACIILMFSLGLGMQGKLYTMEVEEPLQILGFFANLGAGLLYFLAERMGLGIGLMTTQGFDYGTTYLWVCGLLNYLIVLDAFDIAQGRKP